jgi:hypothetical protein
MSLESVAKLTMLKRSLRCMVFGLVSLAAWIGVPFILLAMSVRDESSARGLFAFCYTVSVLSLGSVPFAVATAVFSAQAHAGEKKFWNAARPYRIVGVSCAILSILAATFVLIFVLYLTANNLFQG